MADRIVTVLAVTKSVIESQALNDAARDRGRFKTGLRALVEAALEVVDEFSGSTQPRPAAAPSGGAAPARGVQPAAGGKGDLFTVNAVKDWGDNVSLQLSGSTLSEAWVKFYRDDAADARAVSVNQQVRCRIKAGTKPGVLFGSDLVPQGGAAATAEAVGSQWTPGPADDLPF